MSDGRGTLGDAIGGARLLRAEGVRVDTVAVRVPVGAEVLIDRVDAARALAVGQRADVTAVISSNIDTAPTVRWYLDNPPLKTVRLQTKAGDTTAIQTGTPTQRGFHAGRAAAAHPLATQPTSRIPPMPRLRPCHPPPHRRTSLVPSPRTRPLPPTPHPPWTPRVCMRRTPTPRRSYAVSLPRLMPSRLMRLWRW